MSDGDAGYPEQPPSWSPEQPPPSDDGYGVPPGRPGYGQPGYAAPPPPLPPTPVPGYGAPPYPQQPYPQQPYPQQPAPPSYGQPSYGQPTYGQPQYGQPQGPYGSIYPGPATPAPKPGIIALRPLVFSEILDGAVQAIRSNPRILLWSGVVVVGVLLVLGGGFAGALWLSSTASSSDSGGFVAAQLLSSLGQLGFEVLAISAQTMLAGLLIFSVSQSVLGHQATFAETWARVRPRFWGLLGFTLLSNLAVFVGYIFCCLPGIALAAWFALGAPALVLEGSGVGGAFSRSTTLVKGSFWRVLGILFVSGLIGNLVTLMVTGVLAGLGALAGLIFGSTGVIVGAALLGGIGFVVSLTVVSAFSAAVSSLLYIDQRMRREGLDIALARAAGAAPA